MATTPQDSLSLDGSLPKVPDVPPTVASVTAEARALGTGFVEITAPPEAIGTDADEMLGGEEDLAAFAGGGYPVSINHFMRIRILRGMLVPHIASRERNAELRKRYFDQADERSRQLLTIRRSLARQANAAGLPASLFGLGKVSTNRLAAVLWRVDEVLENGRVLRDRFANTALVDKLLSDGASLVETIKNERRQLGLQGQVDVEQTRFQRQIERLLVDTMRFVGAQGLACFDGDPTRAARYRLDHVYARSVTQADAEDEPELEPIAGDDD